MSSFRGRAVATLLLVALLAGCPRAPEGVPLPRTATVLALGDSLTFGTGADAGSSYPAALASITGWQVENAGVPGETASQICARLPQLLDEHRPALVLVLAGGNDFLRRMPEGGIREALRACVAHARARDVAVAVLSVPRLGLGGLGDAPLYRETADELRVPLVDAGLADLLARRDMRSDAVHLNAGGYRAMAARVADSLAKLGWLRRG